MAWSAWWIVFALAVAAWLYPINIGIVRLILAVSLPVLLAGLTILWWPRRKLRWLPVMVGVLVLACLLAPGRAADSKRLRDRYVARLKQFEGAHYVWGGENRLGIDCSGLLRKGLLNASQQEGLVTLNPGLLRQALAFWWIDNSAADLKAGGNGRARLLFTTNAINQIRTNDLQPGDFAITSDGVHALAYLGNGEWIEADPGIGKVVRVKVPTKDNPWFELPVHLMRWRCLEK
jgi:hypothetical protein